MTVTSCREAWVLISRRSTCREISTATRISSGAGLLDTMTACTARSLAWDRHTITQRDSPCKQFTAIDETRRSSERAPYERCSSHLTCESSHPLAKNLD